jgi:hypothetical protein
MTESQISYFDVISIPLHYAAQSRRLSEEYIWNVYVILLIDEDDLTSNTTSATPTNEQENVTGASSNLLALLLSAESGDISASLLQTAIEEELNSTETVSFLIDIVGVADIITIEISENDLIVAGNGTGDVNETNEVVVPQWVPVDEVKFVVDVIAVTTPTTTTSTLDSATPTTTISTTQLTGTTTIAGPNLVTTTIADSANEFGLSSNVDATDDDTGIIVGVIVGILVVGGAIAAAVVLILKRKEKNKSGMQVHPAGPSSQHSDADQLEMQKSEVLVENTKRDNDDKVVQEESPDQSKAKQSKIFLSEGVIGDNDEEKQAVGLASTKDLHL